MVIFNLFTYPVAGVSMLVIMSVYASRIYNLAPMPQTMHHIRERRLKN